MFLKMRQVKATGILISAEQMRLEIAAPDDARRCNQLDLNFTLPDRRKSSSCAPNPATKSWPLLVFQKADLALAAFGITNERKAVADFLVSFMSYKGAVLLKENTEEGVSAMFHFLRPFDIKVWGMLIGSMFVIAIVLALLHCISPNKTNHNLYESFFFSIGSVLQVKYNNYRLFSASV